MRFFKKKINYNLGLEDCIKNSNFTVKNYKTIDDLKSLITSNINSNN